MTIKPRDDKMKSFLNKIKSENKNKIFHEVQELEEELV